VRGRNTEAREGLLGCGRFLDMAQKEHSFYSFEVRAFQLDSRFLWPIFLQAGVSQLVKMIIAAISAAPPATKSPYSLILHEFLHSLQRRQRQKALDCHYRDYDHVYLIFLFTSVHWVSWA